MLPRPRVGVRLASVETGRLIGIIPPEDRGIYTTVVCALAGAEFTWLTTPVLVCVLFGYILTAGD
jgi:hypothetical protein